ncbi:hypothetical protein [Vagococcus lutrae]|uniref:hypothetical protein n=1 Tax=Vagococcus lutrae TaxID=81947 RepID=UPI00288DD368|nr:hypothetical protein [Vagococcus lutrae]MDT2825404.1 hypothetical protein [Vagococcus lutrae]
MKKKVSIVILIVIVIVGIILGITQYKKEDNLLNESEQQVETLADVNRSADDFSKLQKEQKKIKDIQKEITEKLDKIKWQKKRRERIAKRLKKELTVFDDKLNRAKEQNQKEKDKQAEEEKNYQLLKKRVDDLRQLVASNKHDEEISTLIEELENDINELKNDKQQEQLLKELEKIKNAYQSAREKRIAQEANWTLDSAIEFYEKVHKNSENAVSESIMWENYRRDLWHEVENDGKRILLHWTNISHAGGSYTEFRKEGKTTRMIHYGGNAAYPDDPSIYYIVDNETYKVLNEDEAENFTLNEATALIAFNLFEGNDKHAPALYEAGWKYTGEDNTQGYVSASVGGIWKMSLINNYLLVERTASGGEVFKTMNIPLDQIN